MLSKSKKSKKSKKTKKSKKSKNSKKNVIINEVLISIAEKEHVGWMSEEKYYSQVWNLILSDNSVRRGPSVLVSKYKTKKKDLDFPVISFRQFSNLASKEFDEFRNGKDNVIVWPIGVLYTETTNKVHWNVFIYKQGRDNVYHFDPSLSEQSKTGYAYSKSVLNSVKAAAKKELFTLLPKFSCQEDTCGLDQFCQTWIVLLVDFYLHVEDKDRFKNFMSFDFKHKGKALLKSWLRCLYKKLKHGPDETWYDYSVLHFPGLFHFMDQKNVSEAPFIKKQECWKNILDLTRSE